MVLVQDLKGASPSAKDESTKSPVYYSLINLEFCGESTTCGPIVEIPSLMEMLTS